MIVARFCYLLSDTVIEIIIMNGINLYTLRIVALHSYIQKKRTSYMHIKRMRFPTPESPPKADASSVYPLGAKYVA